MTRTVLITAFGAMLLNIAVIGIFALLPIEEPGVASFLCVFGGAAFASKRFVKRNRRIMDKAERWMAGFYSGLLSILLSAAILLVVILVLFSLEGDGSLPNISEILAELGISGAVISAIILVGILVYMAIHMVIAYFGYGTGQKDAEKHLAKPVEDTFD